VSIRATKGSPEASPSNFQVRNSGSMNPNPTTLCGNRSHNSGSSS
jgi:hypothetical protein